MSPASTSRLVDGALTPIAPGGGGGSGSDKPARFGLNSNVKKSAKWKDGSPCAALMASKVPWSNAKTGSAKALHLITALAVMASCRVKQWAPRIVSMAPPCRLNWTVLDSSRVTLGPLFDFQNDLKFPIESTASVHCGASVAGRSV